jgi:hypothetical protein
MINPRTPTPLGFTHTPISRPGLNTVFPGSRLLLPEQRDYWGGHPPDDGRA